MHQSTHYMSHEETCFQYLFWKPESSTDHLMLNPLLCAGVCQPRPDTRAHNQVSTMWLGFGTITGYKVVSSYSHLVRWS